MYLYLSSKDTSGYHSGNTSTDFTVTLPSSYYFSRTDTWEVGLVDLYIEATRANPVPKPDLSKLVHLYCDSAEPSVFNGSERKILTATRLKDCIKSIFQPSHVRYVALSQERLSTMRMYLRFHDGEPVSVGDSTLSCTLHIKRRNTF